MRSRLKAGAIKFVSTVEEIENMEKHKDKIIAKVGLRTYNRLLKKLKGSL